MPAKLEVIELEIPRLESLLEKIRAALGEQVARPFRQLLDSHVQLLQVIDNQEISLRRLKQLLFGAKTERTRDVFRTSDASSGDAPATARDGETAPGAARSSVDSTLKEGSSNEERGEPGNGRKERRRGKGHGRNGADAYQGCQQVAVPHESLNAGDTCPCCAEGKVYLQTNPRPLVRLVGQAPVGGTVYKMERLRCHLCGEMFTAEPPAGVGEEKYDATAVSMMAVLRYGNGMPWNRSAELQLVQFSRKPNG